jgi:hypothetical protein
MLGVKPVPKKGRNTEDCETVYGPRVSNVAVAGFVHCGLVLEMAKEMGASSPALPTSSKTL